MPYRAVLMAAGPGVRVTRAARRHGISDKDILHAYRNATAVDFGDDGFIMITGARRDGNPLEVGFRYDPDTNAYLILHAMPARSKYLGL